jgi:hypothetical protein
MMINRHSTTIMVRIHDPRLGKKSHRRASLTWRVIGCRWGYNIIYNNVWWLTPPMTLKYPEPIFRVWSIVSIKIYLVYRTALFFFSDFPVLECNIYIIYFINLTALYLVTDRDRCAIDAFSSELKTLISRTDEW